MSMDSLTRVPLLATLPAEELRAMADRSTSVAIPAGDLLFRQGDEGDALYLVDAGMLDAVLDVGTPEERSLQTFVPGDFFGEMALLTDAPRSASIRALTDSRLTRLSRPEFDRVMENPGMALHLSRVLSGYLARTTAELSSRGPWISTLIPWGDVRRAWTLATPLLRELEAQFGPSIMLALGPVGPGAGEGPGVAADLESLDERARPHPGGGHVLTLDGPLADRVDDAALVGLVHRLRDRFGNVVVWAHPDEAFRRLPVLTRLHRTCLVDVEAPSSGPHRARMAELELATHGALRRATLGKGTASWPEGSPRPLVLGADGRGVGALARALAGATLGLALGSGTAQGLSHLGVMKAFVEAGLPIDLIAGTSGGALYGAMIARGLTVDDAVARVLHEARHDLLDKLDPTFPTKGIIRGRRIQKMIREIIGDVRFSELVIPLYAVATDLDTGEEVVIDRGVVHEGVRASIAVPGIFEPHRLDGRTLVDGVVVNPLPVDVARAKGADRVVAVQVPAPGQVKMQEEASSGRRRSHGLVGTIIRSHHFGADRLAREAAGEADVHVMPDVGGFGWREYSAAPAIIEAGYQAGRAVTGLVAEQLWGARGVPAERTG